MSGARRPLAGAPVECRKNAKKLTNPLNRYDALDLFEPDPKVDCSWFAYPIQVSETAGFTRDELQKHLEDHKIETRPILAGNLARQPVLEHVDHRLNGQLEGAQRIHETGLFIGNHHRLTDEKINYIVSTVDDFIKSSD